MNIPSRLKDLIKEPEEERGYHIFSNKHRRNIFRELTRAPCQTSSALAKKLNYDVQDVEWHLKKLMQRGFVEKKKTTKRVFYPSDLIKEEDVPLFSLLNTKSGWIVVRSLVEKCRDINFLYRHISKATAYRVIKKLDELNMIYNVKSAHRLICLNELFYNKMEEYSVQGLEFKKNFIKKVELKGYSVEIIGTYNYEVVIRITGMENFTLGIFTSPLKTILEVKK